MAEVRLQKFLAECGIGSRRKMEALIVKGKVRVNGKTVKELGTKVDPEIDKVLVDGRPVQLAPKGIMLFCKPRGVVSTLSDPEGRPAISDYLTKHYKSYFPVGRLDWETTGLLVLTNDGELAERLMHPRFGVERVYHARVEGRIGEDLLSKLAKGIKLRDGFVQARVSILRGDEKSTWVEVHVAEGRNRMVRRLFEKLEHQVMKLKRVSYGPFKIGSLQPGQMRVLTQKEYEQFRRKVFSQKGAIEAEKSGERGTKAPTERKVPAFLRSDKPKRRRPKSSRWGR